MSTEFTNDCIIATVTTRSLDLNALRDRSRLYVLGQMNSQPVAFVVNSEKESWTFIQLPSPMRVNKSYWARVLANCWSVGELVSNNSNSALVRAALGTQPVLLSESLKAAVCPNQIPSVKNVKLPTLYGTHERNFHKLGCLAASTIADAMRLKGHFLILSDSMEPDYQSEAGPLQGYKLPPRQDAILQTERAALFSNAPGIWREIHLRWPTADGILEILQFKITPNGRVWLSFCVSSDPNFLSKVNLRKSTLQLRGELLGALEQGSFVCEEIVLLDPIQYLDRAAAKLAERPFLRDRTAG